MDGQAGLQRGGEPKKDDLLQQKDDVQAKYARLLFVRCDALEVRHPVVILQNDKANVYHVLEKHFRPEYLAGQERYWKNLREMYTPRLETWRPRVNGVQLKVLQGARLPECEAEWAALDAALSRLAPYLRSDSGVAVLCRELRDFVGLLDGWWANRKRGEGGPNNNKRQAAASLALPINKRQSLEFMQHGMMSPIFVQPEIISHSLLGPPLIFAHAADGGAMMEASDLLVPQAPAAAAAAAATVEAAWVGGEAPEQLASPGVLPGAAAAGGRLLQSQPSRQQVYMMELIGSGGGEMGEHTAAGVQGGRHEDQAPAGGAAADHAGGLAGLPGAGGLNQAAPFRPAGMMGAAGVGLAGGHPAGDMTPRHPYQHQQHQHQHQQHHQVNQHQQQQQQQQVKHHAAAALSSVHPLDGGCSPQHRQGGGFGEEEEQQGRERAPVPGLGAEDRLGSGPLAGMDPAEQAAAGAAAAAAANAAAAAAAVAEQPPPPQLDKLFVALNVGGHRFLTTAATLAVVEGSFLWRLARQCAKAGATGNTPEFFIDRSGKLFEYVLDYLRSARFGERESCLPREERALGLVRREAEFYQLPELAERAAAALEQLQGQGQGQGGGLGSPRTAGGGGGGASDRTAACGAGCEAANVALDSLFLETGLQPGNSLGLAKAALMQQLNNALQAKQAEGYTVVKHECGTEREGQMRNLFYHIVLRKQL